MAWGSKAFASSMTRDLLVLAVFDRLGDRVADRVRQLLAQVADGARDGAVHLRGEMLREARLEIGGEAPLDFRHHAPENFARELRGGLRILDDIGKHGNA